MGRPTKLRQTVLMTDPDSGEPLTLLPGTKPEARLAKLITNPDAWSDEDVEDDGRGPVEQSGPYAGMTFDDLAVVARERELTVDDDVTTEQLLELVVADDAKRADATAKAAAEAEKKPAKTGSGS